MVGEDEFDFSEPGLAELFNQENLVLVYRFSLEIEKARSMFGGHNNGSYEGREKPDDEDVEGNNITESHETPMATEVRKEQGAYKLSEFYTSFNEIKRVNTSCAEYLIGIGFEHWARSHFEGNRYNIMTSNVAETWNSVLREAREYPILSLIEYIRAKLMDWFATRREIDGEGSLFLTPRVQEIVTSNLERSGVFGVTCIRNGEYEMRDKGGESFHVNLNDKCCTCHEFQALLIPCTHAIAAASRVKVRVDSLVGDFYSLETYKTAYASIIYPVGEEERIEILSNDSTNELDDINPPSSRRPPGRPKKTRILSRGEYQTRGPRKRTVCGRCKRPGHNRATCKMAI
ncbi:uncharacterized protein LOC125608157 [Brassica napus]|uniref:uncharacterized protein LOC125608157 n=1 Tax=Brassica napus TaxID=3708 RepID=UPI0020789E6E|nr:uncharacterized protein LOC125608157 [Brassica napus]